MDQKSENQYVCPVRQCMKETDLSRSTCIELPRTTLQVITQSHRASEDARQMEAKKKRNTNP
jgi:hypothetical protein